MVKIQDIQKAAVKFEQISLLVVEVIMNKDPATGMRQSQQCNAIQDEGIFIRPEGRRRFQYPFTSRLPLGNPEPKKYCGRRGIK